jgi:hypothetical protein
LGIGLHQNLDPYTIFNNTNKHKGVFKIMDFKEEQRYSQYCAQLIQDLQQQPHNYRLRVYLVSDPPRYYEYCKRYIRTTTGDYEQLTELIQKLETDVPIMLREYMIDNLITPASE